MRTSPRDVAFLAATVLGVLLASLGALALALMALDPAARGALAGLTDHPWWLVYRGPAGADAPLWALGGAVAAAVLATAALVAGRSILRDGLTLFALYPGLFLASIPFECLRGATLLLVAGDRSLEAAVLLSRVVYWARFTGLLALLAAALYAIELKERRPTVLVPAVLLVALAMAGAVPIDRTVWLAQLTFRLGDEQGVWFATIVIAALVPASLVAGGALRRQGRLYELAASFALLLAARELVAFGAQPLPLAAGLACLAVGTALFIDCARRQAAPAA